MRNDEDFDDDLEYEVEPVDAEVLRLGEERAKQRVAEAEAAVDVDQVYRDIDNRSDYDFSWEEIKLRFGVRGLLIATAVVAILLGAWQAGLFNGATFAGMIAASLLVLGTGHVLAEFRERRRLEFAQARHEASLARARGEEVTEDPPPPPEGFVEEIKDLIRSRSQFSVREMLIATAIACALSWLISLFGLERSAILMGLFALFGLGLDAIGFDLPPAFRLTWWLSVVLYCLLTLGSAAAAALGFG